MCHFLPSIIFGSTRLWMKVPLFQFLLLWSFGGFFFPYSTGTGTFSAKVHMLYSKWIQKRKRKKKTNKPHIVAKSNSLQGATGKQFIKQTCPVKCAVVLTILTTHFKKKNHIWLQNFVGKILSPFMYLREDTTIRYAFHKGLEMNWIASNTVSTSDLQLGSYSGSQAQGWQKQLTFT